MATKSQPRSAVAWGEASKGELRWPASLAVVIALLLYISLPARYTIKPMWLIPVLELALLIPLSIASPRRRAHEARWERAAAVLLIAIINFANIASLVFLVRTLLTPGRVAAGGRLFESSLEIWLTNVIVFALWYWELDRGGPDERMNPEHRQPDFLFPQMVTPGCTLSSWTPRFVDYLFVSFTNATAFSPTDTMPLTVGAKMLMMLQALTSLLTIALVAARSVNILS